MKFTCPCMVLVENEHQQIELETWMKKIGRQVQLGKSGPRFLIAEANQGLALWLELKGQQTREIFARDFIDCGTNIDLFKALAAMNDDNCREQWFVSDCLLKFERLKGIVKTEHGKRCLCRGEWFKVLINDSREIRAAWIGLRRPKSIAHDASVVEIIEHFNKSKK